MNRETQSPPDSACPIPVDWWLRVGHDLRGPISPMRMAVQMLKSGRMGPEDRDEALQLIDRQIDRLLENIEDLSGLLQLNAGSFQMHRQLIDINLAIDVIAGRGPSMKCLSARQQTLLCVPTPDALVVEHDPARLIALMEYLIGKVAQYAPAGATLTLVVTSSGHGAKCSLRGFTATLDGDQDLIYLCRGHADKLLELEARPLLMREIARLNGIEFSRLDASAELCFLLRAEPD